MSSAESSALPKSISLDVRPIERIEVPPVIKRQWQVNWDEFFTNLVSSDKPITFPIPEGTTFTSITGGIKAAAIRRGLNVSIRHFDNDVYVAIRHTRPKIQSRYQQRNEDIVTALEAGEAMETIGHRYSLSRQRVEQIALAKFSKMPFGPARRTASIEFLKPYMEHIRIRYCAICADEIQRDPETNRARSRWLCRKCQILQKVISDIKGYLTAWTNGLEQGRRQAVYLIRKHNIKPEHLAGRRKENGAA